MVYKGEMKDEQLQTPVTDSLTGIPKGDGEWKQEKEERIKRKYEESKPKNNDEQVRNQA